MSEGVSRGDTTQSINRDPIVRAVGGIVMNVLQGLIVVALSFVANNLYQVNLTLAANAVMQQELSRQLAEVRNINDKQEDHLNYVDRRVYTLEGRNLRGADQVPRRGN